MVRPAIFSQLSHLADQ
jgi:hypothetical protein